MASHRGRPLIRVLPLALLLVVFFLAASVTASPGDRLPEFKQCLELCQRENCGPSQPHTPIPFLHRLLLWDCASECDYTCQHIITARRIDAGKPIVQFHGKWPFYRFLGMQEPFSVIFSLGNLWAHWNGLTQISDRMPASYSMRPFYIWLSRVGIASWIFSAIFHTRDFQLTEELDYFAAGASVLYGMYYTPVRIFRLDRPTPRRRSVLRAWTLLCGFLYICHVAYLKGVRWDYTYNMAANVAAGVIQNLLWSWFSYDKYRKSRRTWAIWPGLVVAWVTFAMSMELFDFPPWLGSIDAHSLWHLMTIGPTILWYKFLIKDAHDDIAGSERLKS
ncbi:Per1-like-domain-containing protein [Stachybotrys elegans]|uniref:Post-GPI attachment to proteins factor 3 n=1 Tax=Stachybotrys elegans TaxID=80388 RepID=A0A8K0T0E0_9HYPO|nr:Per1-like-domain-containing protein [Stachybotrys elegans]